MKQDFSRQMFTNLKIDYLYVVVGCFYGYFDKRSNGGDRIELFFVNEKEAAILFRKVCQLYLLTTNLPDDTMLEFTSSGASNVFSKSMGTALEKFFEGEGTFFRADIGQFGSTCVSWSDDKKLSYLLGVYIRHLDGIQFKFANSFFQAGRVHSLLSECSDEGDWVIWESHFNTPHISKIRVNDDHAVLAELAYRVKQLKEKVLPQ